MHFMSQVGLFALLSLPLIGAYAMLAVGVVVIFRASKVLNLAHGAMAMLPAFVVVLLHDRGLPMPVAVVLGVASGALLGMAVERLFVRPLARQGPTAQTVGTVAVYGLVVAAVAQFFGSGSRIAVTVFPEGSVGVGTSALRYGDLGLFGVALLAAAGLIALFRYTRLGLHLRGAAENPSAASLMGVDPTAMARLAWALGGGLAGLAGILLAAVTNANPYALSLQALPAFVAALIGGLASVPGAVVGAVVVGLAQGMVPVLGDVPGLKGLASQVGMPQLVLAAVAMVVMYTRGARFSVSSTGGIASSAQAAPTHSSFDPSRVAPARGRRRALRHLGVLGLVLWPFVTLPGWFPLDRFSLLGDAILAGEFFIVAASVVLLTGWVGQISLAQASFVGVGAFGTALVARHLGVGFPISLVLAGLLAAGVAAALGVVALRVRGLYLAVATLIFAWMVDEYLFVVPWFAGTGGTATVRTSPIGVEDGFPFFDFTDRRTFYFVILAMAAAVIFGLMNLRDSKTGRAFAAIRGSEAAAAALGIDVRRTKLFAFAAAGLVAGVGGNLTVVHQVTVVPNQFSLTASLMFLAIAVVGGLNSLGGAVTAAAVFAGLNELFFRVPSLGSYLQLTSALLLAAILLLYPGGLAAVPQGVTALAARLPWRRRDGSTKAAEAESFEAESFAAAPERVAVGVADRGEPVALPGPVAVLPDDFMDGPVLQARGVTVRFGGLTAVDDVTIRVDAGQIVGLIGPNGAGKTTIFNAISGLNRPSEGRIELLGRDVTDLPVHQRAAAGLGRTFQVIQVFPELTVFENLLVATHTHNRTGPLSHLVATARAVAAETDAEALCREVVRLLGLDGIADRPVAGLPFGTLRAVELARALASRAPVVMLDEPASGLDNRETDRMAAILRRVRTDFGVSILLIEHDVRMVTGVSDHLFVLNRGRLIAEGAPGDVQRDPAVMAAYLGRPAGEELLAQG